MIIWSGRGLMPLLLIGITLLFSAQLLPAEYLNYSFILSFFLSGLVSWYFGKRWNKINGQTVTDKSTGRETILIREHSLFWIKMEYWGLILCSVGFVVFLQGLL